MEDPFFFLLVVQKGLRMSSAVVRDSGVRMADFSSKFQDDFRGEGGGALRAHRSGSGGGGLQGEYVKNEENLGENGKHSRRSADQRR